MVQTRLGYSIALAAGENPAREHCVQVSQNLVVVHKVFSDCLALLLCYTLCSEHLWLASVTPVVLSVFVIIRVYCIVGLTAVCLSHWENCSEHLPIRQPLHIFRDVGSGASVLGAALAN